MSEPKTEREQTISGVVKVALLVAVVGFAIVFNWQRMSIDAVIEGDLFELSQTTNDWCINRWGADSPYHTGQMTVGRDGELQIKCSTADGTPAIWSNLRDEAQ